MRILLATSNPHKLQEVRAVFSEERAAEVSAGRRMEIELVSLRDLGRAVPEPCEDQATFESNAILKARYYAAATGMLCLADDSGLVVDALNAEPGVRSARYAGITGPRNVVDPANNRLLLERLKEVAPERRTARFVCAMALVAPSVGADAQASGTLLAVTRGVVEGRILGPEGVDYRGRGSNGFGYDPLFLITELSQTTAELSEHAKNAISHRGRAARQIWRQLSRLEPQLG